MSYKFTVAEVDNITVGNVALPTTGTFSAWWKSAFPGNVEVYLFYLSVGGSSFIVRCLDDGTTNAGWFEGDFDINGMVTTTSDPTANIWNHILLTFSPTSTKLYINGSQVGSENTNNGTFDSSGVTKRIGIYSAVASQPITHYIAEMAFWSDIKDAGTIAALASGIRPSNYPANGVNYWPMVANAVDDFGSDDGTVNGASIDGDHPTMSDLTVSLIGARSLRKLGNSAMRFGA